MHHRHTQHIQSMQRNQHRSYPSTHTNTHPHTATYTDIEITNTKQHSYKMLYGEFSNFKHEQMGGSLSPVYFIPFFLPSKNSTETGEFRYNFSPLSHLCGAHVHT